MNTPASAYRPFQFGLLASVLFFVGYTIVGWNGWGTPAAVEQAVGEVSRWCERVQPGLFHEPVNALSNLGFMVAGLWMLWCLGGDVRAGRQGLMFGHSPVAILYAGAAIWLGPGSLLMHGTHTGWGGWADNLSMVMYILIPWLINVGAMGRWTSIRLLSIYSGLVLVYGVGRAVYGWGLGINLDFFGLSIAFWVISEVLYRFHAQHFRWLSGLVGFAVAGIFGITPLEMWEEPARYWWVVLFWVPGLLAPHAPSGRRNYWPWFFMGMGSYLLAFAIWQTGKPAHPWCNPDSLIQAHGIWHLLSAVATACFFVFLRTERKLN
ncbi:ceramidase domain-containing protein [Pseudomonadales bacterium]|jgi:hypothetical protein|nr:ceramidase domain-containing protein [Pseudomonadales bacterium]